VNLEFYENSLAPLPEILVVLSLLEIINLTLPSGKYSKVQRSHSAICAIPFNSCASETSLGQSRPSLLGAKAPRIRWLSRIAGERPPLKGNLTNPDQISVWNAGLIPVGG
jgi:hypothetical protein